MYAGFFDLACSQGSLLYHEPHYLTVLGTLFALITHAIYTVARELAICQRLWKKKYTITHMCSPLLPSAMVANPTVR